MRRIDSNVFNVAYEAILVHKFMLNQDGASSCNAVGLFIRDGNGEI